MLRDLDGKGENVIDEGRVSVPGRSAATRAEIHEAFFQIGAIRAKFPVNFFS